MKILVLENQVTQFEDIITALKKAFSNRRNLTISTHPSKQDWLRIMNLVRIFLNPRYSSERQNIAIDKLKEYIESITPDYLIIDYRLSGSHNGKKGTFLARKLKTLGIMAPILFLSRTDHNDEDVKKEIEKEALGDCEWIPKGYAGSDIGDDSYFEKYVVENIIRYSKRSKLENLTKQLNKLAAEGLFKIDHQLKMTLNTAINSLIKKLPSAEDKLINKIEEILNKYNCSDKSKPQRERVAYELKTIREE